MIDVSGVQRSSSQIKRSLALRRAELSEDMDLVLRGKRPRAIGSGPIESEAPLRIPSLPVLSVAAVGAVLSFLVLRRTVWPLRAAGRLVELAAPAMVPVLVRRVLGRE